MKINIKFVKFLKRLLDQQFREVSSRISLSSDNFSLNHWNKPMFEVCRPFYLEQFKIGMKDIRSYIANRPGSPFAKSLITKSLSSRILDAVDAAVLQFCQETNNTTSMALEDATERLRNELREGLINSEDAYTKLTDRVINIFNNSVRAQRIAVTESARAKSGGLFLTAKDNNLKKKKWFSTATACPICVSVSGREFDLETPFYIHSTGGPYAVVMYPPMHPWCFCSMTVF